MQASSAWRLRHLSSKPADSETNKGAVLNGFMIGSSAPTVSMIAWPKIVIASLPQGCPAEMEGAPARLNAGLSRERRAMRRGTTADLHPLRFRRRFQHA